jgi:hypothetical protein
MACLHPGLRLVVCLFQSAVGAFSLRQSGTPSLHVFCFSLVERKTEHNKWESTLLPQAESRNTSDFGTQEYMSDRRRRKDKREHPRERTDDTIEPPAEQISRPVGTKPVFVTRRCDIDQCGPRETP